ncbi:hypothetical protein HFD88_009704 [Aspergillus terreus]|nr:hypothetical protein HFD88_009704 [Aspergillus terreus]
MALSFIIPFSIYLLGVGDRTTVSISRHPVTVLGACGVHVLFGRALNHLHKRPEYRTITTTLVIGSVAQLVTAIMPQKWTILAPVIGIGFEAIFLSFQKPGRTPEHTMIGGTDIQAMTINHGGLPKALLTPRLVIPSHVFLGLLIVSPFLLDLHLRTLFPKYPVSVGTTAGFTFDPAIAAVFFGFLVLEHARLPVVSYFKVIVVPTWYLSSTTGE